MSEEFFNVIKTKDLPAVGPYQRASAKPVEKLNQEIESLGVTIEDGPEGPVWKKL